MPAALQASVIPSRTKSRRARSLISDRTPLTAKQKRLIVRSFLRVEPALDLVAQLFFIKLFRLDPNLRQKFDGPVEIQARKFTAGMKLTMISLGHEDGLAPTLRLLGARHRQLGIRSRHYRTMSKALIWTLGQSLEESFDRDTKEAWTVLLDHLTRIMEG